MKTILEAGNKVYFRETFGGFSRFRILTVISVDDKLAKMDNGSFFVRAGFKQSTMLEYFIEHSLTKKYHDNWFLCDDKKLTEANTVNTIFNNNKDLIKANILINSIVSGLLIPTDEEKLSIYDVMVKTKNNNDYYENILR